MSDIVLHHEMVPPYFSPWIRMDYRQWSSLISNSIPKTYEKDTVIYHQGDEIPFLYFVKKGRVRLDIYAMNGKQRSLYIADEGTCFGELSCFDRLPQSCTATTCTLTSLYHISYERLIQEIHSNSSFSLTLLKTLSLKARVITNLLEQINFNDSHQRLFHSLISLIQLYGLETAKGHFKLNIKFTHQEMAYQTGLSRVCISNIFLELKNRGYIEKENGYLIIKDLEKIEKYLTQQNFHEKDPFYENLTLNTTDQREELKSDRFS